MSHEFNSQILKLRVSHTRSIADSDSKMPWKFKSPRGLAHLSTLTFWSWPYRMLPTTILKSVVRERSVEGRDIFQSVYVFLSLSLSRRRERASSRERERNIHAGEKACMSGPGLRTVYPYKSHFEQNARSRLFSTEEETQQRKRNQTWN